MKQKELKAKMRAEWLTWDWAKQDIDLGEKHDRTRERVRQIRKLLRKPRPARYRKHRDTAETRMLKQYGNDGIPRRVKDVAYVLRVSESAAVQAMRKCGMPVVRLAKYPWHTVDWRKPNRVIAAALGAPVTTVGAYRYAHKCGPSAEAPGAWLHEK